MPQRKAAHARKRAVNAPSLPPAVEDDQSPTPPPSVAQMSDANTKTAIPGPAPGLRRGKPGGSDPGVTPLMTADEAHTLRNNLLLIEGTVARVIDAAAVEAKALRLHGSWVSYASVAAARIDFPELP